MLLSIDTTIHAFSVCHHQFTFAVIVFQTPAWLTEMIQHPTWRSLIYRLAEEYPDCLMLNFTIKVRTCQLCFLNLHSNLIIHFVKTRFQLISDAGFQGEITSISTAAQQIEVFSRVLKTAIAGFLQNTEKWQRSTAECAVSRKVITILNRLVSCKV